MNSPLFSLVIPTKDRLPLLQQTLDSIRPFGDDREVIVVDDGSVDGTVEYLKSCEHELIWLRSPGSGPAAARNQGLAIARGDYVAFLDSDDLWFPWTSDLLCQIVNENNQPATIVHQMQYFTDPAELDEVRRGNLNFRLFDDHLALCVAQRFVSASMLTVNRKLLVSLGGFDESLWCAEDHDLSLRLGLAKRSVQILSPATVGYRQHAGNISSSIVDRLDGIERLISKERAGQYPGSAGRQWHRRDIILSHAIPLVIACLEHGKKQRAIRVYCGLFYWSLKLRRFKYLAGFWWKLAVALGVPNTSED